jgi:putative serine protease PepD
MRFVLAALPGLVALIVAVVALGRAGDDAPAPAATPAAPAAAPTFRELYERVDGVVARIDARRGPGDPPFGNGRRDAIGAAFVIDERGHVVTNAHVVERARSATVRFARSSERIPARIVGVDAATDLAVLRVDPDRLGDDAPLPLAPADSVRVGDTVLAVGTPFRLQSSASAGIVSAVGREIEGLTGFAIPDSIQTDAAINPGNSGGPLVDARGRVVGVNSQGRGAGVGFAVSSTTMRRVIPQLIEDGRARAAYLGVGVGTVTDRGTRLTSVADDGPAAAAGLRTGDTVTRIGDRATATEGALASAVAAQRPGARVPVRFTRDGRARTVTVRFGTQPRRG